MRARLFPSSERTGFEPRGSKSACLLLTGLVLLGCQSPGQQTQTESSLQSVTAPQADPASIRAATDRSYIGDGFSVERPEGWFAVDRAAMSDGTAASKLPVDSNKEILETLTATFDGDLLVAFYDIESESATYIPNITLSQVPLVYAAPRDTAETTAAALSEQGFAEVDLEFTSNHLGEVAELTYELAGTNDGGPDKLYATSIVIFSTYATWTLTGLTSHTPESIDAAVAEMAETLLES